MPAKPDLGPYKEDIRQFWLLQNMTGKQVSRILRARGVKASARQVNDQAHAWGFYKILSGVWDVSEDAQSQRLQHQQPSIVAQRQIIDGALIRNQTNNHTSTQIWTGNDQSPSNSARQFATTPTFLRDAVDDDSMLLYESDKARDDHLHSTTFGERFANTFEARDFVTFDICQHNSWLSQGVDGSVEDVGSHWLTTLDKPGPDDSQGPQSLHDLGTLYREDTECPFDSSLDQVGSSESWCDSNGPPVLYINPQCLIVQAPTESYENSGSGMATSRSGQITTDLS